MSINNYPHLIVSSAPRSGSTPLAQLLGQQKDVFVMNEIGIYDDWDNANKWQNFIHTEKWINFVANENIFKAHNLDLYAFRKQVIVQKMSGKGIFKWLQDNTNVSIIGDKCPITYINNMPMFAKKFPNAKFIIIVRDGRDVIASQIRGYSKWPPGNPDHAEHWMKAAVKESQHLWLKVNQDTTRSLLQVDPKRVMVFRYEDAVTDQISFCNDLSEFLDVNIYSINNYFKPVGLGSWQNEHPNMMGELSVAFKAMLVALGY